MAESIVNTNEQRSYTGSSGNNSNNSNALNRRKTNNGGDLTASPKYGKSNVRGSYKDSQYQKQNRTNANNSHQREQRNSVGNGSSNQKQRNIDRNRPRTYTEDSQVDSVDVYDDLVEDFSEVYDIDEQISSERKTGPGQGKKKNINHLLNFKYLDSKRPNGRSFNSNYYFNNRWSTTAGSSNRQSFSKEQFLQANCQFVVQKNSIDYSPYYADPDLAVDWDHVEQVYLHSAQLLKCPICLSEPQAGKITRCGHVYCWSCLLHYLALSDKSWRKCPVCCESVYKKDIRSVRNIISQSVKPGDWVHFRLMRRERGSTVCYPRTSWDNISTTLEIDESIMEINKKSHAHLLFVNNETILDDIIEKENLELLKQLEEDGDQPESCFVRQALEENNERRKTFQLRVHTRKSVSKSKSSTSDNDEQVDLLLKKPDIVYENAFDDKVEDSIQNQPEKNIEENNESESNSQLTTKSPSPNETQNHVYFYQADEIYHGYLNGLNTRILIHEYGSYQKCPDELHVRVEAVETYFMTEELRSQFRFLRHLPLTCEFQLVEIRLHSPLISSPTMEHFSDEIHRRRQLRLRKERMETRRRERAELAETQKLFSQYPPEMMYFPQPSFPINSTDSMEEFPAMISNNLNSSQSQSASVQISDENLSPPSGISFAQMLKQQAPPVSKSVDVSNKMVVNKSLLVDSSSKSKKKNHAKTGQDSEEDSIDVEDEYYISARNFQSSFSLEHVFDRLKSVNGEESSVTSENPTANNAPTKKKNKKNKQILFATGLGGQAKL